MDTANTHKPKTLYTFGLMPCPPEIGAHHRILNIGRQLKKYSELTAVYVGPACDPQRILETEKELGPVQILATRPFNASHWPGSALYKLAYHWPWFYGQRVGREDRRTFEELAARHDLLWFHTLTTANAVGRFRRENAIADLDDINQIKHQQMGRASTSYRQKIASALLAKKWRRREEKAKDHFARLMVCSEEDRPLVGRPGQTVVIPNGFNPPDTEPIRQEKIEKILGFLGFIGYTPNRQGLEWFAQSVWPKVLEREPAAKLRAMGRCPDPERFARYPRMEMLGFVENTALEMARWCGMIVPLHFGGGTRLKILDAFSKKCPVISTRVGAHGLKVSHQKNILLADEPEDFADQCIRLLQNPSAGQAIAEEAWKLFLAEYTWDRIGEKIEIVLNDIISGKNQTSVP
ncbi:MAG TPA: glycosyltransferase [Anaerohalosphaeraceae bacterium]|jgi:glycosyltransferase involved in cell wall biosynthesis|nr:glycosyltransferase [Anaerohalosphaeraceae bacterium]